MYVAKFSKKRWIWTVDLFDKNWSDVISSHEIRDIGSHKFLFHSTAKRWVRNEIIKDIVRLHELEIVNG